MIIHTTVTGKYMENECDSGAGFSVFSMRSRLVQWLKVRVRISHDIGSIHNAIRLIVFR